MRQSALPRWLQINVDTGNNGMHDEQVAGKESVQSEREASIEVGVHYGDTNHLNKYRVKR